MCFCCAGSPTFEDEINGANNNKEIQEILADRIENEFAKELKEIENKLKDNSNSNDGNRLIKEDLLKRKKEYLNKMIMTYNQINGFVIPTYPEINTSELKKHIINISSDCSNSIDFIKKIDDEYNELCNYASKQKNKN